MFNKTLTRTFALVCLSALLISCAGRQAMPVAAIQPGDDTLTCPQLEMTLKLNSSTIKGLMEESSSNRGKNVAAGVAGAILFFPALFFMDTKNAADDEARALVRRNELLHKRHTLMNCTPAIPLKNSADYIVVWE